MNSLLEFNEIFGVKFFIEAAFSKPLEISFDRILGVSTRRPAKFFYFRDIRNSMTGVGAAEGAD